MKFTSLRLASALTVILAVSACGGGAPGENTPPIGASAGLRVNSGGRYAGNTTESLAAFGPSSPLTPSAPDTPLPTGPVATLTPAAAAQFLAQATFGPTSATISELTSSGKEAWLTEQFKKPQSLHRGYVQNTVSLLPVGVPVSPNPLYESFWKQAVTGDDQLRQRVTFALSQIFVVSTVDDRLYGRPAGVASYYDMLGQQAFGNFRDLLQGVALHPMMGMYLSHMHNQKESGSRVPDENFAREIMQLMTIGLYQLNDDGSQKLQDGRPVETYTHDDVAGLAKVFTGWGWAGPDQAPNRFNGVIVDPARDWTPMQNYAIYHATSAKSFLGTNIGGGSGVADLKVALDTLFQHPNVGPFIGRQLIQRMVSSNPSPAYISRVAAAFANNGSGVRGDMRAVIRAILLDPEAADSGSAKKLREPVLRLAHWMRAFNARPASGRYQMGNTDEALGGLAQTPLRSPSVFNFFRPSYTPPNTMLSEQGLVAPEMQITAEPSVTGYLNYMQGVISRGAGPTRDIKPDYSAELALAAHPALLVDRLDLLLHAGHMSPTLRNQIISALDSIILPAADGSNAGKIDIARKNRVYMAIYLAMASPEYLAQR